MTEIYWIHTPKQELWLEPWIIDDEMKQLLELDQEPEDE